jgi:hypothetical protein
MRNVPPKSRLIFKELHDVISCKVEPSTTTSVLQIQEMSKKCAVAGKPKSSQSGTGGTREIAIAAGYWSLTFDTNLETVT